MASQRPRPRRVTHSPNVHSRRALVVLTATLGLGGACTDATPPDESRRLVIAGEPSCAACEIVVEEVVTLGSVHDPGSIGSRDTRRSCIVGQLASGGYVSSGIAGGGEIFVYDAGGAFAGTVGRRGEGPGELGARLSLIVGPGDTLFVMDRSLNRMTVLDPTGDYARSFRLPPYFFGGALLRDGGFILHTLVSDGGPQDRLLRRYDAAGREIMAHERPSRTMVRERIGEMDRRIVRPSRRGDYWSARYWTYELHHWAAPGELDLVISRDAEWFSPGDPETVADVMAWYEEEPPPNILSNLWEAEDGLLWTYSLVADPRWKPESEDPSDDLAWELRTWDTVVEVLDPAAGTVLASVRRDESLLPVCGSDLVFAVRESPDGDAQATLFRARLVRRERGER